MTVEGPRRADARRNRRRILDAAREVFAEQGIAAASLGDVARRAGIGPGTLWRHFSGREALAAELVGESLDGLAASARRRIDGEPAGDAIRGWADELVTHVLRHRGLAEELACTAPGSPLRLRSEPAEQAAADLVEHARAAGAVSPELTAEALFQLCTAVAWTCEQAAARGEEPEPAVLLRLVLGGVLRTS